MKRKIFTGATFFGCFYFSLTVIILVCGFLGTEYTKKNSTENGYENISITADNEKSVSVLLNGKVKEISLNEYLYGVVAAEMPAEFEKEALKAQAVAARTETIKKMSFENE